MTTYEILGLFSSIVGTVCSLMGVVASVIHFREQMAVVRRDVEDLNRVKEMLIDMFLQRGMTSLLSMGLAKANSPVQIKPEAACLLSEELKESLKSLYRKMGRFVTRRQLLLEIHRQLGDEILEVCVKHPELPPDASYQIALSVAQNSVIVEPHIKSEDKTEERE